MLCQKCNKREATTHVRQTINGHTAEYELCSECAASMGYKNIFNTIGVKDLISNFFGEIPSARISSGEYQTKRCPECGMSFNDIVKTGRIGCAACYDTFYKELLPSLQRIHGRTQHVGKAASTASPEAKQENELERLKKEMQSAVESQEFEKAAKLRDEIAELEKGKSEE